MSRRIGIFLPSLRGGGAERVAFHLATELSRRGYRVDVVLAQAEGPYLERLPEAVQVHDLRARRVMYGLPRLVRYLRSARPHAVLSTLGNANVALVWARRFAGVATRIVLREPNTVSRAGANARSLRERWLPWFIRRFYPWADAVVANSAGSADDLAAGSRLRREAVHVIPNPLDLEALAGAAAEPCPLPELTEGDGPLLVAMGRLTHQKGFDVLLEAVARVRRSRPARLLILGEGEERPSLEKQVEELGLSGAVALPGFCERPWPVTARASLFVLSSRWEGQPNALMEAIGVGVPVVSTDCPSGPREVLLGGELGPLVPVDDAEALATGIETALEAPVDPARLRRRAEDYALGRVTDRYLEVLLPAEVGADAVAAKESQA